MQSLSRSFIRQSSGCICFLGSGTNILRLDWRTPAYGSWVGKSSPRSGWTALCVGRRSSAPEIRQCSQWVWHHNNSGHISIRKKFLRCVWYGWECARMGIWLVRPDILPVRIRPQPGRTRKRRKKVLKGASFSDDYGYCRAANREAHVPLSPGNVRSFRCVYP